LHINQMHRHDQVLKLMGSLHYKSLILTGEDFFLPHQPLLFFSLVPPPPARPALTSSPQAKS
jgi:hypothetical protein